MEYVTAAANNPVRNILVAPHSKLFPLTNDNNPPTVKRASEEKKALQSIASNSVPNKNGSIGMSAPTLNATKLLTAALQGDPSCSIEMPNSSFTRVSNAICGLERIWVATVSDST